MGTPRRGFSLGLSLVLSASALGQSTAVGPQGTAALQPQPLTPSRVLAGLRGYGDEVVAALLRLADSPSWLQGAAGTLGADEDPLASVASAPGELREAIALLSQTPEVLLLAADHPEQMGLLRSLWSVAPEGVTVRLDQLRRCYVELALEAAWVWQRALENDPVALGEYRDLLTRFCEAQRQVYPDFACVYVMDRRYYYACPPNDAVIYFADGAELPPSLSRVLAEWWSRYSPERVDIMAAQARRLTRRHEDNSVYAWPAQPRATMWQSPEAGRGSGAVGLVPVALQPPGDQAAGARVALAIAEHARLWSPAIPAQPMPPQEVASRPVPAEEAPGIVIEEAIPGTLSAQLDREARYDEFADEIRRVYLLAPTAGYYYGYSGTGWYSYGPSCYTYLGAPVVYPTNGRYVYDPRRGGARAYVSWQDGRVHYGGGGHYGSTTISTGRQGVRYCPPVAVRMPPQGRARDSRHTPALLRPPSTTRRDAVPRLGRSGTATRVIRRGPCIIGTRPRAIRSGSRVIRTGSGAPRSGPRAIRAAPRSSGRAIRPPSRVVRPRSGSAVRSGGGVRRR